MDIIISQYCHLVQHPDRFLFEQVRAYFPITDQLVVYNLIAKHVERALQVTKTYAARGYKPDGSRLRCRATTRRSTPCMRNIVPGTEYCPSHQHLAEPHFIEDGLEIPARRHGADGSRRRCVSHSFNGWLIRREPNGSLWRLTCRRGRAHDTRRRRRRHLYGCRRQLRARCLHRQDADDAG